MILPVIPCLKCEAPNDGQAHVEGDDSTPEPGDLSICAYCGNLTIFAMGEDGNLTIREPNEQERKEIEEDEYVQHLLQLRVIVIHPPEDYT